MCVSLPGTLALTEGLGSVTLCDCGTVSLHIGGVTVRMELATFTRATAMCQDALQSLRHHPQPENRNPVVLQ